MITRNRWNILNTADRSWWKAYLSSGEVLSVLLFTGGREEDDVVYGLNELQLDYAFDKERSKQPLLLDLCRSDTDTHTHTYKAWKQYPKCCYQSITKCFLLKSS